ncbi:EamA family transporter [Salinarimonas sp.]|uniref:EamA family transporter n=1 Tax=Salinarimonas sp. TaxID=2766526 RepID=UPI0032D8BA04
MSARTDILVTALAPAVWGSTYLVTTELLPHGYPITVAMLRALPAGLLLLLVVRRLPEGAWWGRVLVLGALNFSVFWVLLFVAAYRLPGGVAATVGAVQPLVVIALARLLIGTAIRLTAVLAAVAGLGGVALLVLTPQSALDPVGVAAGLGSAASMAAGTVLIRLWRAPVPPLTLTAWQLAAGGLLLLPVALVMEPALPVPSAANLAGFLYLGLIGGAATYLVWFRGLSRLEPGAVAPLGLLSPVTAVLLGWLVLAQDLTAPQLLGMGLVLGSVVAGQRLQHAPAAAPAPARTAAT